ncbi:ferredoxin:thioredoxin reductase [Desulfovibrio sp. OttesenSCG-928-G15]|nr:ferredoxin:thioredoxin reductase [Desulfovibrio sp. OttesenSCG-928-G15]
MTGNNADHSAKAPVQAPAREDVQKLHEQLKKLQEPKGYFFNVDDTLTWPLLEQLLVTKARYGYMACPCRLANGTLATDRDIICPCQYRTQDVEEFGACFCGLYVSKEWNEGKIPQAYVPDRRAPEKITF